MNAYRRELKNGFERLEQSGGGALETADVPRTGPRSLSEDRTASGKSGNWQQTAERWIISYPAVSVGLAITAGVLAGWAIKRR